MVSERARAKELGYKDPIQPDIGSTHAAYNAAIDFLVTKVSEYRKVVQSKPVTFVVASHNQSSVQRAVEAMQNEGLDGSSGAISFAQLMGMQDGTSYALAANGFKAFKVMTGILKRD